MRQVGARELAFSVLLDVEREKTFSNIGLNKALNAAAADGRDRALVTRLVYGVTERRLTLDYEYRLYLQKNSGLKPNVRTLLRMGVYEVLFLDGVPARAAVNEYVALSKRVGAGYASGMINAVLRRTAERGLILPAVDSPEYPVVKYSVPSAILNVFENAYGDALPSFLESLFRETRVYGRINTLKTEFSALCERLGAEGVSIAAVPDFPEMFYFSDSAAFAGTEAFRDGLFYIQDLSSVCAGRLLDAKENMRVLDVCASPGGKSFFAAVSMNGTGEVVSRDIFDHKTALIREGALRLGLDNISIQLGDAVKTPEKETFDRVICDVPCSGLGVIRKKPELRYRDISDIPELSELQYRILCAAAQALKPGGRIVYSTCTVTAAENEEIVRRFLAEHPRFSEVRPALSCGAYGDLGVRFAPHSDNCDGFYACAMEKA